MGLDTDPADPAILRQYVKSTVCPPAPRGYLPGVDLL